jgi:molecular chaperone IbpA
MYSYKTYQPLFTTDFIESILKAETKPTYPPINQWSDEDGSTFISIALAGFKRSEISVKTDRNILSVVGKKEKVDQSKMKFSQRNISFKEFKREWTLSEFAVVKSAVYEDGLLTIELVVEVPEDKKPVEIDIK